MMKKKRSNVFFFGVILVLLGLCVAFWGSQLHSSQHQTNQTSRLSKGSMDSSKIKAPQVGLSDRKWNQSLGARSDGKDTNSKNAPTRILTKNAKSLIVYFSRSGSTELLASKVQARTGADVIELVPAENYSSDYRETVERANGEREREDDPALKVSIPDLSQYDTIYLGYPIWGMTLAEPMASFIEEYSSQLAGKTVVPFSTNGSYGVGSSVERIERILRERGVKATVTEPYTIQGNKVDQADASLTSWLKKIKVTLK